MKTKKFKSSSAVQDVRELELPYETGKKFADYKEDLAKQFCCDPLDLKLIYKGRIIPDEIPAEEAHITEGSLVIVVISAKKSPPKVSDFRNRKH